MTFLVISMILYILDDKLIVISYDSISISYDIISYDSINIISY